MLIEQSCGPLYAVSADHDVLARELAAATAAINGEVRGRGEHPWR